MTTDASEMITSFKLDSLDSNWTANDSFIEMDTLDIDEDLTQTGITRLTQILAILGVCICTIGIIGNFFSIIVLNRKAMKKLSTYTYLLGLSVCDEISLTFTIMILFNYAMPAAQIPKAFAFNYKILLIYIYPIVASTQALSVWITLAFTVDRYLFICHPYYGRQFCTRSRAFIVLGCLFVFAAIYSIPQYLERTYIIEDILNTKHVFMSYTRLGRNKYFIYTYHLFIYCTFVFFIPILLIIILNIFLVNDIIKSNKRHRELSIFQPQNCSNLNVELENRNIRHSSEETKKCCCLFFKRFSQIRMIGCLKSKKESTNVESIDLEASQPLNMDKSFNISVNNNGCLIKNPSLTVTVKSRTSCSTNGGIKSSFCQSNNSMTSNDVGIMLVGLIIVFLICQLPSSILRLITFKNLSIFFQPIYASSLDVSNFLIVTNSTLNCVLYVMLGQKFRREFLRTFFPKCYTPPSNNFF